MVCRALNVGGLRAFFSAIRCGKPATHRSPDGMLFCEKHALVAVKAMHAPNTIIGILARKRGIALEPVEVMLSKWRIQ